MGLEFFFLKSEYISCASDTLSAESIIILPSTPSTIIEFAIPKPIATWTFPPGVSYDNISLLNSLEWLTNISTLEILGIGVDASCEQLNKNTNAKNPMAWLNFFIESTNKRPKKL